MLANNEFSDWIEYKLLSSGTWEISFVAATATKNTKISTENGGVLARHQKSAFLARVAYFRNNSYRWDRQVDR